MIVRQCDVSKDVWQKLWKKHLKKDIKSMYLYNYDNEDHVAFLKAGPPLRIFHMQVMDGMVHSIDFNIEEEPKDKEHWYHFEYYIGDTRYNVDTNCFEKGSEPYIEMNREINRAIKDYWRNGQI
jgi:hypothetical protein